MTAYEWVTDKNGEQPPANVYCATRDVSDGRLSQLYQMALQNKYSDEQAALITALAGELASNCFDHNLGAWSDIPGCWLEFSEKPEGVFQIIVADRGQGLLSSLQRVKSELGSHKQAIITALTEEISGRAPERRGRGLKFVTSSLNGRLAGAKLEMHTGNAAAILLAPVDTASIAQQVQNSSEEIIGTYAQITIPIN